MNIFNAAEILEMGIEKEKKRRDFYGQVAQAFSEAKMKELFSRLKDWEEEHVRKIEQLKKNVDESQPTQNYPGQMKDYIQAMIEDKLYKEVSPEQFSENVRTPQDAIRYGIGFEKDAILFFNEVLPLMKSPNKKAIQAVIDEEKQHIVYLSKLQADSKN